MNEDEPGGEHADAEPKARGKRGEAHRAPAYLSGADATLRHMPTCLWWMTTKTTATWFTTHDLRTQLQYAPLAATITVSRPNVRLVPISMRICASCLPAAGKSPAATARFSLL